jgi:hypothetical protein
MFLLKKVSLLGEQLSSSSVSSEMTETWSPLLVTRLYFMAVAT